MEHMEFKPTSSILVSACLLGEPTRYDGGCVRCEHPLLEKWNQDGQLVPVCPEVDGGLSTPRPPAETSGGDGRAVLDGVAKVLDVNGQDVTENFILGAHQALNVAQDKGVIVAILKARSPSCGSHFTYNGSFSGNLIPGFGVTTALLVRNGIRVFNEDEIEEAKEYLQGFEPSNQ